MFYSFLSLSYFCYYFLYFLGNCVCWTSWGWFVALSDFLSFVGKLTFARADWLSLILYGFGKNVLVKNLKLKPCQLTTSMLYIWSYSWLYKGRGRLYTSSSVETFPPGKKFERLALYYANRKEGASYDDSNNVKRKNCDNTSTILEPESHKVKDK